MTPKDSVRYIIPTWLLVAITFLFVSMAVALVIFLEKPTWDRRNKWNGQPMLTGPDVENKVVTDHVDGLGRRSVVGVGVVAEAPHYDSIGLHTVRVNGRYGDRNENFVGEIALCVYGAEKLKVGDSVLVHRVLYSHNPTAKMAYVFVAEPFTDDDPETPATLPATQPTTIPAVGRARI